MSQAQEVQQHLDEVRALRARLGTEQWQETDWGRLERVAYLSPTDKSHRLTRRLSQEQKGLEERALMASQRPSEPW